MLAILAFAQFKLDVVLAAAWLLGKIIQHCVLVKRIWLWLALKTIYVNYMTIAMSYMSFGQQEQNYPQSQNCSSF